MRKAVLLVCDGLRADMIRSEWTPNLCRLAGRSRTFSNHSTVFPSTTRTTSASIATGCRPGRHGLEGNAVALDEGDGLIAVSAGSLEFRDRLERATGRTLAVPTLAERLAGHGGGAVYSNVSAGAAYFHDPDGHGFVYHRQGSYGPSRRPKTVPPTPFSGNANPTFPSTPIPSGRRAGRRLEPGRPRHSVVGRIRPWS